jgi:hypothetical protein
MASPREKRHMKACTLRNQRGAVIIHVAIALLALLAFTSFVVDYGIMWVSRRQAQTAADAGALAGAVAMAFDGVGTDPVPVRQSAHTFANKHAIWGESVSDASTEVATSLDSTPFLCPDGTASCVRVDVFRGAPDRTGTIRGTALPVFFSRVVGLTSQAVRATATAEAGIADASDCLKPWAVADRWVEVRPTSKPWDPLDMFDRWDTKGGGVPTLFPNPDYYVPATTSSRGSGFNPTDDFGMQLMLKMGTDNPKDRISSGWFLAIDLPGACKTGGDCYREHIMGCSGQPMAIGEAIDISTDTLTGAKVGPTVQGVEGTPQGGDDLGLIEQDPDAHWVKDSSGPWVSGQPQPGHIEGSRYATSPRIVTVPLFNPDEYQQTDPQGKSAIHITNIMGFFIEGVCGGKEPSFPTEWYIKCAGNNGAVIGRLMTAPGIKSGDTIPIGSPSAFLKSVRLVR